jgi:hypothetical protein
MYEPALLLLSCVPSCSCVPAKSCRYYLARLGCFWEESGVVEEKVLFCQSLVSLVQSDLYIVYDPSGVHSSSNSGCLCFSVLWYAVAPPPVPLMPLRTSFSCLYCLAPMGPGRWLGLPKGRSLPQQSLVSLTQSENMLKLIDLYSILRQFLLVVPFFSLVCRCYSFSRNRVTPVFPCIP